MLRSVGVRSSMIGPACESFQTPMGVPTGRASR